MPYIKPEERKQYDEDIIEIICTLQNVSKEKKAGHLNYVITRILLGTGESSINPSYETLNELIGVLECAKLEFYRRILAVYEDAKIEMNGDVF